MDFNAPTLFKESMKNITFLLDDSRNDFISSDEDQNEVESGISEESEIDFLHGIQDSEDEEIDAEFDEVNSSAEVFSNSQNTLEKENSDPSRVKNGLNISSSRKTETDILYPPLVSKEIPPEIEESNQYILDADALKNQRNSRNELNKTPSPSLIKTRNSNRVKDYKSIDISPIKFIGRSNRQNAKKENTEKARTQKNETKEHKNNSNQKQPHKYGTRTKSSTHQTKKPKNIKSTKTQKSEKTKEPEEKTKKFYFTTPKKPSENSKKLDISPILSVESYKAKHFSKESSSLLKNYFYQDFDKSLALKDRKNPKSSKVVNMFPKDCESIPENNEIEEEHPENPKPKSKAENKKMKTLGDKNEKNEKNDNIERKKSKKSKNSKPATLSGSVERNTVPEPKKRGRRAKTKDLKSENSKTNTESAFSTTRKTRNTRSRRAPVNWWEGDRSINKSEKAQNKFNAIPEEGNPKNFGKRSIQKTKVVPTKSKNIVDNINTSPGHYKETYQDDIEINDTNGINNIIEIPEVVSAEEEFEEKSRKSLSERLREKILSRKTSFAKGASLSNAKERKPKRDQKLKRTVIAKKKTRRPPPELKNKNRAQPRAAKPRKRKRTCIRFESSNAYKKMLAQRKKPKGPKPRALKKDKTRTLKKQTLVKKSISSRPTGSKTKLKKSEHENKDFVNDKSKTDANKEIGREINIGTIVNSKNPKNKKRTLERQKTVDKNTKNKDANDDSAEIQIYESDIIDAVAIEETEETKSEKNEKSCVSVNDLSFNNDLHDMEPESDNGQKLCEFQYVNVATKTGVEPLAVAKTIQSVQMKRIEQADSSYILAGRSFTHSRFMAGYIDLPPGAKKMPEHVDKTQHYQVLEAGKNSLKLTVNQSSIVLKCGSSFIAPEQNTFSLENLSTERHAKLGFLAYR